MAVPDTRRHHPAARRRGGRGGHGGTRWRRGRAPPQGEKGPPCASRIQSERPRHCHHREPCGSGGSFLRRRGREAGVVASGGGEGKRRPSRPRRGRHGGLRKKRISKMSSTSQHPYDTHMVHCSVKMLGIPRTPQYRAAVKKELHRNV
jgi:hypothetical protein